MQVLICTGLLPINDYDSLLFLLRGTKYYDALLQYKPNDDKPFDSNMLELELMRITLKSMLIQLISCIRVKNVKIY